MSSIPKSLLESFLSQWIRSLENPAGSQSDLLRGLLQEYAKNEYGIEHNAESIEEIEDYRRHFPVITYEKIKPIVNRVAEGQFNAFLSERPTAWVMTRGSTGKPKLFPVTRRHLQEILHCGARAIVTHALGKGEHDWLITGSALSITLPSRVGELKTAIEGQDYGYSSGVYARLNSTFQGLKLVPDQEKVDEAGLDLTTKGWERRFEQIYQIAKNAEIAVVVGVAPVQVSFAWYMKRKHNLYPKDLWKIKAVFPTSVAKIQTRYSAILKHFYGDVDIVEMYSATEGAFAQQKDVLPYIVPNYDTYFFEVERWGKFSMLHELKRGEWGRLVVSTCILPRYDMSDYVEAMGNGYFRVFGRTKRIVLTEHLIYRALFGWLV